jgi:hypothetical protein
MNYKLYKLHTCNMTIWHRERGISSDLGEGHSSFKFELASEKRRSRVQGGSCPTSWPKIPAGSTFGHGTLGIATLKLRLTLLVFESGCVVFHGNHPQGCQSARWIWCEYVAIKADSVLPNWYLSGCFWFYTVNSCLKAIRWFMGNLQSIYYIMPGLLPIPQLQGGGLMAS